MLVYYIFMTMLYLIYYLMLFVVRIGHSLAHVHLYPNKRPICRHAYVIYSAVLLFAL
jgi:hypothetical protein